MSDIGEYLLLAGGGWQLLKYMQEGQDNSNVQALRGPLGITISQC